RARGGGRLQEGAGRGRTVPLRVLQSGCRAGGRGLRRLLAESPPGEAPRLQVGPDESTRLAMIKRGETDVAYSIRGPNAEEVKRTPGLTLKATYPTFTEWLVFTQQWDPKSPLADRRVRLAANLAIDRKAINDAEYLGFSKAAASIIPRDFEFSSAAPAYAYDPAKAKQLLAGAGYPKGFDAVEVATDAVYAPEAEAVINGLQAIGIRAKL